MPTTVLGISCDYHDAAAALLVDGRIAAAAEQERFSRTKHDGGLPEDAVRACLELGGIEAADLDHVVFYEKPLVLASRFLATRQRQGPGGLRAFLAGAPTLNGANVFVGARVAAMLRRLGAPRPPRVSFVEHHRSHAAAAFLPSPHEHAAILTIDGLGEWATATIGVGAQHRTSLLEEQRFPNSIGLVYSFITAWCGFSPNSDEYKLMGLAPYGTDRFAEALAQLVDVGDDGAVRVDARAMGWFDPRSRRARALAGRLGGPPRRADEPVTQRDADLAASVQRLVERAVLAMAARAHELTGERALCLAGGVALNSVANGLLAREGPFEEIWVQPAAGDAGSALGAALALWHEELGHPRAHLRADEGATGTRDAMAGALLGTEVADADAIEALVAAGIAHQVVADRAERDALVAERLAAGDVVAMFQGRMEFGPRALGNRSILADPRSPTVRERINLAVKGRESFRPFAPAVLADHAADWFELDQPSPYMLLVAPVRAEHLVEVGEEPDDLAGRAAIARSTIPACTHVDGSARIQTVDAATHPDLHRLLVAFYERTGCPMLLNTSFNRAGEPIVERVDQAVASARAAGVDLLVIGPAIVRGADL
ncbi:MAG: carbamoyltransferase N-terminal domain-containing protein [Acidimicrobiales bacterium]